jgi:hypothetical protein
VHEGGFRIAKDYRDRWFFKRPDGRAVPACGYCLADRLDDDVDTADETVRAHPSAEGLLIGMENRIPGTRPATIAGQGSP